MPRGICRPERSLFKGGMAANGHFLPVHFRLHVAADKWLGEKFWFQFRLARDKTLKSIEENSIPGFSVSFFFL